MLNIEEAKTQGLLLIKKKGIRLLANLSNKQYEHRISHISFIIDTDMDQDSINF